MIPLSGSIDKVAWLRIEDRRVLCARSRGKESYFLPGGKREPGETDQETLIREIGEELSVRLLPESLVYFDTFAAQAHGKPEGVMVQMRCYTADYAGELTPAAEIAQAEWLSYADREKLSLVVQIIFDHLHQTGKI